MEGVICIYIYIYIDVCVCVCVKLCMIIVLVKLYCSSFVVVRALPDPDFVSFSKSEQHQRVLTKTEN